MGKVIKVSEFIDTKYRSFWNEANINRNVFIPYEMLMTIERRIIWSAYKIGMTKLYDKHEMRELSGEVAKYHIAGDGSIQDSIKGLAQDYKRQPAVRILKGIGNMGAHAGDPGAAARYTSVEATPLLLAIFRDLKYVPYVSDVTGLTQPEYVSSPLPMVLINGLTPIGTGKAAYYDERDALEVIDWIDELRTNKEAVIPDPISTTGCKIYKDPSNGYTYYEAIIERDGKYDIITALPPKVTTQNVIATLKAKNPKIADKIVDGSGEGKSIYIRVPKGHIKYEDFFKFNLKKARIETPYIWDNALGTMRLSNLNQIALDWFEDRISVVTARLKSQEKEHKKDIHKIDIIQYYVEKEMNRWKSEDILKELGEEDGNMVLSQTARAFLPESLNNNKIKKAKIKESIKEIKSKLSNIEEVVLEEAREIITAQEKFFKNS